MNNIHRVSLVLALTNFLTPGAFAKEPPEVERLMKGMPKAVASFIARTAECNHWGGEEAYDKAREKQIEKAVKRLRCDQLDSDETKLRAKYKNNPKVLKAIEAAKEL